jgi:TolB protein
MKVKLLLFVALVVAAAVPTAQPAGATFPGANGPIAFRLDNLDTGESKPLFRAQPDGTAVTELYGRAGFGSDWSADGTRIAFDIVERDGDVQIATMAADGSDVETLTSGQGIHEIPSWSPNGRRIVYDFSRSTDFESPDFETHLWTMRADGSGKRRLEMRDPGFDVEPRYSPNGEKIAFGRIRILEGGDFRQAIFVVDIDTGRVRQLTPWRLMSEHPTWSPDGRWVLYNNSPNGTVQIVRPSGKDRTTIAPATREFGGHKPWFSPDGTKILLMCENQGTRKQPPPDYNQDICVMNADGSNLVHVISTTDVYENWPSWGPAAP